MIDEKKKLSDWLIASDIDGTLNNKFRRLPKRNYEAIHKFVDEFGGNFILSSGRSIESMRKHFEKLKLKSGYCVFINGAGVYDYKKEEILWLCPLEDELQSLIVKAATKFKSANLQIDTPKEVLITRPTIAAMSLALSSKLKKRIFWKPEKLEKGQWCKAIFMGTPWTIKKVEKYFYDALGSDAKNLMCSSPFSFEVVSEKTNKGVAVLKAAEIIGADKNKTAAIGDYFNDYQMLKSVALPACCGQAPKGMKEIAKLVTCHCNKGAVADLIEYIIKNYSN